MKTVLIAAAALISISAGTAFAENGDFYNWDTQSTVSAQPHAAAETGAAVKQQTPPARDNQAPYGSAVFNGGNG